MAKARILIVEDEPALSHVLVYNFEAAGYEVSALADGEEALLYFEENGPPDLLILDWMLPEVSGMEICRRLRARDQTKTLPILMLTARGEESDRLRGFSTGADDYVVKPFSLPELLARAAALLRRARPERVADCLTYKNLVLDRTACHLLRDQRVLHIGPTEFRLLETLMEQPERVFTRAQLLDRVWGSTAEVEERTIDVHIGRLRKILTQDGGEDILRTVRGIGYSLSAQ